ncbi:hypothetical protein APHMUC_0415 [Anaplasma phagocytophilum str. ApMUC09]|uniref:Uncharacterized protein n=1 Tax=Anaplasma phagocytophilum str. ApMUC09 TaxID=1359152 RepID=A0A0F3NB35_ANAPH|nr:hypothetical protein APHMUC_0415 [Anaplasma phagocytophilum str. ApMUC09]
MSASQSELYEVSYGIFAVEDICVRKGDDRENIQYIIGSSKSDLLPFLSSLSSTS